MRIFRYQYINNAVYHSFCKHLNCSPEDVQHIKDIPFLPISFFKTHHVYCGGKGDTLFTSSGTTGQITSKHFVSDVALYEQSFNTAFKKYFGKIEGKCILGLLPSYLDREGSSLVYMVNNLIQKSANPRSGFYLRNYTEFAKKVEEAVAHQEDIIVFGVSYALLDLAEGLKPDLYGVKVIETGGMKGMRKEISKAKMHQILKKGLNLKKVYSEYGMTELLSQAYSMGNERFQTPPWMRVLLREQSDPLNYTSKRTGAINVIDLANINSCSFIATEDLGRYDGDYFKVLGRMTNADVRGCNLMYDY